MRDLFWPSKFHTEKMILGALRSRFKGRHFKKLARDALANPICKPKGGGDGAKGVLRMQGYSPTKWNLWRVEDETNLVAIPRRHKRLDFFCR
jgi:hypothetical protein